MILPMLPNSWCWASTRGLAREAVEQPEATQMRVGAWHAKVLLHVNDDEISLDMTAVCIALSLTTFRK